MKKINFLHYTLLLAFLYSATGYTQTYDQWRTSYGLAAGTEYQNPDGDDYLNYEEYGFGLNPNSADPPGKEFFSATSGTSTLTIGSLASTDLSYRIYRADDYSTTNKYVDWLIFASRWASEEWVGDYLVNEVGETTISITIPSAFSGQKFKCEVTHESTAYPNFDWEHMKFHTATAQPITPADYPYLAENGWGRGPIDEQKAAVVALNPNYKSYAYVNSGIETHDFRYDDLNLADWVLVNDNTGNWATNPRSGLYMFDYRKPVGYQRRLDIMTDLRAIHESAFFDALGKVGGSIAQISGITGREAYLEGYFNFCEWTVEVYPELRMINYDYPSTNLVITTSPNKFYRSTEAIMNNYFNAYYNEFVYSDKDIQRGRMDWTIERWTRHGKVYVHNEDISFDPADPQSHYQAAVYFTLMGRNSSWQGSDLTPGQGGWKHASWMQYIYPHRIGESLAPATRDAGYIYTHDFENLSVVCNVETKAALIKFFDDTGDISAMWGNIPDIPVTGVNIAPTNQTLSIGEKQQLTTTVIPSNAITKGVTWSSSNSAVAKVSKSGIVTALSAGTATITGQTVDGHFTGTSVITVSDDGGPLPGSDNLALYGIATQSSTDYGGLASRAIDNNTDGTYGGESVTHTTTEANPWWQVDLGENKVIGDINIFGRTDACCASRLSDYTVLVIDASGTTTFSQNFTTYPTASTNAGNVQGKIIRILLNGTEALSLAEVQVMKGEETQTIPCESRIEAEDYNTMSGIRTQPTDDIDGIENVGWVDNGDWISFENVDFSCGITDIEARVASATSGGTIEIRLDNATGTVLGTISVSNTGGWQNWVTESSSINNVSGTHDVYLVFIGGVGSLLNINWLQFTASSSCPEFETIQAEAYDAMSGLSVSAGTDIDNTTKVSLAHNGDWAVYNDIDLTCATTIGVRTTSVRTGNIEIRLDGIDGQLIGTVATPNTGNWGNWVTTNTSISSVTGTYDVYFVFKGGTGSLMNFNWFEFSESQDDKQNISEQSDIVKLYPNPVYEMLKMVIPNSAYSSYTIFDINGREQAQGKILDDITELDIDMGYLSKGFYMIRLKGEHTVRTLKVIKN